jgi:conjugal transfer pilus assembly protein TraF
MRLSILFFLLLGVFSSTFSFANEDGNGGRFLDRKEEGFFWYKDPAEEIEKEPEPEIKPVPPPPAPAPAPPSKPQDVGPPSLSAAWLKVNIPLYLSAAIDDPSEENVKAFLYLQHYSMEKASTFADAAQEALVGDPVLDGNNQRPISTFANKAVESKATQNKENILESLTNKIGIFYFANDGDLSQTQNPILEYAKNKYPFSVVKIAFQSSTPFEAGQIPDNGKSEMMGVSTAPSLVVVREDGTFDIISQAPISLATLLDRIILSAKRLDLIDHSTYDSIKPIANKSPIKLLAQDQAANDLPVPPSKIISLLKPGYDNAKQ